VAKHNITLTASTGGTREVSGRVVGLLITVLYVWVVWSGLVDAKGGDITSQQLEFGRHVMSAPVKAVNSSPSIFLISKAIVGHNLGADVTSTMT
jgi:hypothetical protein